MSKQPAKSRAVKRIIHKGWNEKTAGDPFYDRRDFFKYLEAAGAIDVYPREGDGSSPTTIHYLGGVTIRRESGGFGWPTDRIKTVVELVGYKGAVDGVERGIRKARNRVLEKYAAA